MEIIFDTDIGDYLDDAMALALVVKSPDLKLKAVVTNNRYEYERALVASKLLGIAGRNDIPVFQGRQGGKGALSQREFIADYSPGHVGDFHAFLHLLEEITGTASQKPAYLSLGSLTNVASILEESPQTIRLLRLVIMGGSLCKDYNGNDWPAAEWNIFSDVPAAQKVFSSGADITMVGLDATWDMELPQERLDYLRISPCPLHRALGELACQWKSLHVDGKRVLHDPFAVAILMDDSLAQWEECRLEVDDQGFTRKREGPPNVRVALSGEKERFLNLFNHCLMGSFGKSSPLS